VVLKRAARGARTPLVQFMESLGLDELNLARPDDRGREAICIPDGSKVTSPSH
jgi:hypothetical protein